MSRRTKRPIVAAIVTAACALGLSGCSDNPSHPRSEPSDTATTPAITIDPDFYTWQQARTYTGEKAAIATTVHAADYYGELPVRPGGGIPPELKQVTTKDRYGLLTLHTVPNDYPQFRGPVTSRLMSIRIKGDHAIAVWCHDASAKEIRKSAAGPWRSRDGMGVFEFRRRFVRSATSPTGWRMGQSLESKLTRQQCRKALRTKEPAISKTGPPKLPALHQAEK